LSRALDTAKVPFMSHGALHERLQKIATDARFDAVAVGFHDYETGRNFSLDGTRFFHAASTIKIAILIALYRMAEEGRVRLGDTLHVRNRFRSLVGGEVFRVAANRDGDSEVHGRLGRSLRVAQLARPMITRSSNLATNLLLDYMGIEAVLAFLKKAKIDGVEIARGVEDNRAFEAGLNNRVTADGLVKLLRLLCEGRTLRESTREQVLEILHAQEFNSMIPEGLPKNARVAHKTGEISTVCHDAGIVFLPGRKPYVVAILTEMAPEVSGRTGPVAEMSRAIFEALVKG
jgi:beta-lactamase class A